MHRMGDPVSTETASSLPAVHQVVWTSMERSHSSGGALLSEAGSLGGPPGLPCPREFIHHRRAICFVTRDHSHSPHAQQVM